MAIDVLKFMQSSGLYVCFPLYKRMKEQYPDALQNVEYIFNAIYF
jgi:hypothetical protein